jgi:lipoprotein-anchoring transpeptidase ErfK/SrfK
MYRVAFGLPRACALALLVAAFATPAFAQVEVLAPLPAESETSARFPIPDPPPAAAEAVADQLRPGQFRWLPEAASADGPVRVVVSLPLQRVYVFRGASLVGISTTSTGEPGYDTPTGTFRILQKKVHHRSNLYDDAPMPYMQRLTWDGIALHAGEVRAEPASHGCIRLPAAFARRLFAITELGTQVTVMDVAPSGPEEALTLASAG